MTEGERVNSVRNKSKEQKKPNVSSVCSHG